MNLSRSIRHRLLSWAKRIIESRTPDFVVGGVDNPYMQRWFVIPHNPFFNIYLHRFLHDDDDRALHTHPWASVSLVLDGGYFEHFPYGMTFWRHAGSITCRSSKALHRISLQKVIAPEQDADLAVIKDQDLYGPRFEEPDTVLGHQFARIAISLFLTGPKIREWGFACPQGWIPWYEFVDARDSGKIGKGCGEN